MNSYASSPSRSGLMVWLGGAESWMDSKGRPAWIIAMVLGFILAWPIGLALLAYMIWSKRMFSCSNRHQRSARRPMPMTRSSGNSAFDAYREETLRRLQEEQDSFESFLDRLRKAKDQAEFDQFMDERAKRRDEDRPFDGDPHEAGQGA